MTIEPVELFDRENSSFGLRWIVYIHLAAVSLTLCLTLADRGLLISPTISRPVAEFFFYPDGTFASIAILFPLLGCPLLMFCQLLNPTIEMKPKMTGTVAEFLVTIAHLLVMGPLV